jgi:hypothetical protein
MCGFNTVFYVDSGFYTALYRIHRQQEPMEQTTMQTEPTLQIAVLDRGFVYVGLCQMQDGGLTITNAQNIRRWGTSAGLGELASKGPQAKTKIDRAGTVRAPMSSVVHLIDCNADAWASLTAQAA